VRKKKVRPNQHLAAKAAKLNLESSGLFFFSQKITKIWQKAENRVIASGHSADSAEEHCGFGITDFFYGSRS
jgi:hypothetical protein